RQLAEGLSAAHVAGIVHRDLKPDNIFLIERGGEKDFVKILDFGIAKTPQSQFGGMETRTGVTMGTPYYMSPEQVEGKKAVDFRTDLWAMGVIACECMTGVRPFDGSTYGELLLNICARPVAPPSAQGFALRGFDEWFAKATSRDAEQRFTSAQELASTLKDVVTSAGRAGFTQLPPRADGALPAPTHPGMGPAQAYAPAMTGVPSTVAGAGAAPTAATMNTSQPLVVPRSSSALPWLLLVGVLLSGAVAVTIFVMRPHANSSSESIPSALPTASANAAPIVLAPEPSESASPPVTEPSAKPVALSSKPASAAPAETRVTVTPPTLPATPPTPPATKALRCFSDPFSGQVRPTSAATPAGTATFGCRQDPFTGKYKRL
ncbi:MAG TPA: protein kinase, partial [Polyangiaceae bacterium]|nr:protein kinase [Polyangiaceae bacterium]